MVLATILLPSDDCISLMVEEETYRLGGEASCHSAQIGEITYRHILLPNVLVQ